MINEKKDGELPILLFSCQLRRPENNLYCIELEALVILTSIATQTPQCQQVDKADRNG